MPVDPSLVGRRFPPTAPHQVTAERVAAFSAATAGPDSPDASVPATYPIVVAFDAMAAFLDAEGLEDLGETGKSSGRRPQGGGGGRSRGGRDSGRGDGGSRRSQDRAPRGGGSGEGGSGEGGTREGAPRRRRNRRRTRGGQTGQASAQES